jgi:hypothetical protein
MAMKRDVLCVDCIYFVDSISTCSEYNALVKSEEERNCYFFREIPVVQKDEPIKEQPEPIKAKAPKKAVKKKARKRRVPVPA